MHQFGHIWFNQDPNGVTLQLDIIPPPGSANWNFVFRNDGITNDGSLALYTSDDPNLKVAFTSFGGIFAAPTLNPNPTPQGAPAYTQLTFRAANSGGKMFFYQLNCVELATGNIVSWDPIIVNKM